MRELFFGDDNKRNRSLFCDVVIIEINDVRVGFL